MTASGANAGLKNNPRYYESLKNDFIEYPSPFYEQVELVFDSYS